MRAAANHCSFSVAALYIPRSPLCWHVFAAMLGHEFWTNRFFGERRELCAAKICENPVKARLPWRIFRKAIDELRKILKDNTTLPFREESPLSINLQKHTRILQKRCTDQNLQMAVGLLHLLLGRLAALLDTDVFLEWALHLWQWHRLLFPPFGNCQVLLLPLT